MITEHSVSLEIDEDKIVSKDMPVFYNKAMSLNRTISLLVLKAYFQGHAKKLRIADILAGSGIRSLRFLREWLADSNIEYYILINDLNPELNSNMSSGLKKNFGKDEIEKIKDRLNITNKEANIALMQEKHLDYIDIDPFGSPNPYLDSAIKRVKHNGIIAITATDTAPLCGTYPKACRRKYFANPLRNQLMHESGLRILIRKAQLIGMQYERALIPILSLSVNHYMRVFFKVTESKELCNEIFKQHRFVDDNLAVTDKEQYGPLWIGKLYDKVFIEKMIRLNKYDDIEVEKLLQTLSEEYDCTGFFDTHEIASKNKTTAKNMNHMIDSLEKKGFIATRTHFKDTAIKTNATEKDIVQIMNE